MTIPAASSLMPFIVVVLVVIVVLGAIGWSELGQRRDRLRAAKAPGAEQIKRRGEFITALIEKVGWDTSTTARVSAVCGSLRWTKGQIDLVMGYLSGKGLVEKTSWFASTGEPFETIGWWLGGARVRLTAAGLDEAERAEKGPTENLPQIIAIRSIVAAGSGARAVGAIDSPRSKQTVHTDGVDPAQIKEWIASYRDAVQAGALSAHTTTHVEQLLDRLDDALERGDDARILELGRSLRGIAEGAVGSAVFAGLIAAATSLFG